jgi:hypothetical protein
MTQPFACPHCGSPDYVVVLSGCTIKGATVEEAFAWNEEKKEYDSSGALIVDSSEVENESAKAICSKCEREISEAVAEYEESQHGDDEGDKLIMPSW